ncbi:hypothetical protein PpBr36_05184 [Pyricularia pennisetigena]|uniref:hypothetical protein n=1 Tax=Pyricularia pennisetigena TaxID=1578925 RepID=UPI001150CEEB|nr:hypothetical protein PpBr36_05184 [Pyricularia pennisetigena]TLS27575.1 hypothetical protein PpBr36_05184 [Pyricularia pennisetigena]
MPHFGLTHDACQQRRPVASAPAEPLAVFPSVLPTTLRNIKSQILVTCVAITLDAVCPGLVGEHSVSAAVTDKLLKLLEQSLPFNSGRHCLESLQNYHRSGRLSLAEARTVRFAMVSL